MKLLAIYLLAGCLLCSIALNVYLTGRISEHKEHMYHLSQSYRQSIEQAARWIAERQAKLNRSTFFYKGIEMNGPKPFRGYPICQLGCIVSVDNASGIPVDAESLFIGAYNDALLKLTSATNTQQEIPAYIQPAGRVECR